MRTPSPSRWTRNSLSASFWHNQQEIASIRPQLRVELGCCLGPLGPARGPRECGFGTGWAVKPAGCLQMHRELMEQARGPSDSSPASSSESQPTSVFPAASKLSTFSPWPLLLLLRFLKQSLNPVEKKGEVCLLLTGSNCPLARLRSRHTVQKKAECSRQGVSLGWRHTPESPASWLGSPTKHLEDNQKTSRCWPGRTSKRTGRAEGTQGDPGAGISQGG